MPFTSLSAFLLLTSLVPSSRMITVYACCTHSLNHCIIVHICSKQFPQYHPTKHTVYTPSKMFFNPTCMIVYPKLILWRFYLKQVYTNCTWVLSTLVAPGWWIHPSSLHAWSLRTLVCTYVSQHPHTKSSICCNILAWKQFTPSLLIRVIYLNLSVLKQHFVGGFSSAESDEVIL